MKTLATLVSSLMVGSALAAQPGPHTVDAHGIDPKTVKNTIDFQEKDGDLTITRYDINNPDGKPLKLEDLTIRFDPDGGIHVRLGGNLFRGQQSDPLHHFNYEGFIHGNEDLVRTVLSGQAFQLNDRQKQDLARRWIGGWNHPQLRATALKALGSGNFYAPEDVGGVFETRGNTATFYGDNNFVNAAQQGAIAQLEARAGVPIPRPAEIKTGTKDYTLGEKAAKWLGNEDLAQKMKQVGDEASRYIAALQAAHPFSPSDFTSIDERTIELVNCAREAVKSSNVLDYIGEHCPSEIEEVAQRINHLRWQHASHQRVAGTNLAVLGSNINKYESLVKDIPDISLALSPEQIELVRQTKSIFDQETAHRNQTGSYRANIASYQGKDLVKPFKDVADMANAFKVARNTQSTQIEAVIDGISALINRDDFLSLSQAQQDAYKNVRGTLQSLNSSVKGYRDFDDEALEQTMSSANRLTSNYAATLAAAQKQQPAKGATLQGTPDLDGKTLHRTEGGVYIAVSSTDMRLFRLGQTVDNYLKFKKIGGLDGIQNYDELMDCIDRKRGGHKELESLMTDLARDKRCNYQDQNVVELANFAHDKMETAYHAERARRVNIVNQVASAVSTTSNLLTQAGRSYSLPSDLQAIVSKAKSQAEAAQKALRFATSFKREDEMMPADLAKELTDVGKVNLAIKSYLDSQQIVYANDSTFAQGTTRGVPTGSAGEAEKLKPYQAPVPVPQAAEMKPAEPVASAQPETPAVEMVSIPGAFFHKRSDAAAEVPANNTYDFRACLTKGRRSYVGPVNLTAQEAFTAYSAGDILARKRCLKIGS